MDDLTDFDTDELIRELRSRNLDSHNKSELESILDFDIENFDTKDLLDELFGCRTLDSHDIAQLRSILEDYVETSDERIGLLDSMKRELFDNNIDKFSLEQFEKFLETI